MICPRCNNPLETTSTGGIPTRGCPHCSGTWISGASLNAFFAKYEGADDIVDAFDGILDLEFHASRRKCPSCSGKHLKSVVIDDTELDYCVSCKGLFFDKGELETLFPDLDERQARKPQDGAATGDGILNSFFLWLRGDR